MSTDEMDNTLNSTQPSERASLQEDMSYLIGRDPSILAFSQRPLPSSDYRKNLMSLYEEEELGSRAGSSTGTSTSFQAKTVKVYLRMKPFPSKMKLTKEQEEAYTVLNSTTLVTKLPSLDANTSTVKRLKGSDMVSRSFTFTSTFGPEITQQQLFDEAIKQQMMEFVAGQSATVMSYGTTNAGKSYTLQGTTSSPGIIPRGLEFVFSNINPRPTPCYKPIYQNDVQSLNAIERANEMETKTKLLTFGTIDKNQCINAYKSMQRLLQEESPMRPSLCNDASYSVWVSFAEIYNECIFDLLSNDCQKKRSPLKLATDSRGRAFIRGLKMVCVNSGSEAYQVLMAGQYNLKVAATAMNARSSRSHCIFTIKLLKYYKEHTPNEVEVSTFSFCDLAGSERLKKTLNVGERLKEAQNINTSLLVLGRCLKSIWECQSLKQKNEIMGPFRESKLTRLFQRALSGKELIALIVNINPIPNLYVETQNVLNFSAIAKQIVIEQKNTKRKRSTSGFSQMVCQSIKNNTDWDTMDLESIDEVFSPESTEKTHYIDPEDYEELLTENERLKREIKEIKRSAINRDFEIRQEMSNTYDIVVKNLEASYKNCIKDSEERDNDMLTWSINKVEEFYKDKLKKLSNRKRRRSDSEDESDDEKSNLEELEADNTQLTAKVLSLKELIKQLRDHKETLATEKNKSVFELGLVNEELKSVKKLLEAAQKDMYCDQEATCYIEELTAQLAAKEERIKTLKKFLNEAKEEYIAITTDVGRMEDQLREQNAVLVENDEKITDLEEQLDHTNICLAERTKSMEKLEEQFEDQSRKLMHAEERAQIAEGKLSKSEAKNLVLLKEIEDLQKMVIEGEEKGLKNFNDCLTSSQDSIREFNNMTLRDLKEKLREATDEAEKCRVRLTTEEEQRLVIESKLSEATAENEALNDKLTQSRCEIKQLKDDLQLTKVETNNIMKVIEDLKLAASLKVKTCDENVQTSFVDDNVENKATTSSLIDGDNMDESIFEVSMESGNQTTKTDTKEQIGQTSLVGTETEEKNSQTSFIADEKHNESEERLQQVELEYSNLKTLHENESMRLKEVMRELENARRNLKTVEETSNANELIIKEYKNTVELIEKELQSIAADKERLEMELAQAVKNNGLLEEKASDCEQKIGKLENELKQNRDKEQHSSEISDQCTKKIAELESQLSNTNSLMEQATMKCLSEHVTKIDKLEKEIVAARERDDIKTQCMEAHSERISKLEGDLVEANKMKSKITELENDLQMCRMEKDSLQRQLDENDEKMTAFENQLQEANCREQEKDDEILHLQNEVKKMIHSNALGSQSDKQMEKGMKDTLRELTTAKESLTKSEEAYKKLEQTSKLEIKRLETRVKTFEENAEFIALLREDAESRQAEKEKLMLLNDELNAKLMEKDRELQTFIKNRDDMTQRYESLVKSLQEDVDRNKREVTRFQEVFMRQTTPTPRKEEIRKLKEELRNTNILLEQAEEKLRKGAAKQYEKNHAKSSDEESVVNEVRSTRRRVKKEVAPSTLAPPSDDILVIELSGSESKRTTRRTALGPPAAIPSTEKKRQTRRKKLFSQVDDTCVDVEPTESLPRPQPSPLTATRNLRNRRK